METQPSPWIDLHNSQCVLICSVAIVVASSALVMSCPVFPPPTSYIMIVIWLVWNLFQRSQPQRPKILPIPDLLDQLTSGKPSLLVTSYLNQALQQLPSDSRFFQHLSELIGRKDDRRLPPTYSVYSDLLQHIRPYPSLLSGLSDFLEECYPILYMADKTREAQVQATRKQQEIEHKAAAESQSSSPLLNLPRELRNKIWGEVVGNNILHVAPTGTCKGTKAIWGYYLCRSPARLQSSACPAGVGDHKTCKTGGASTFVDLRTVCKLMSLEIEPWDYGAEDGFWRQNAVQFANLREADAWLFGIHEERRRRLGRVRIALSAGDHWAQGEDGGGLREESEEGYEGIGKWEGICNYFSNPWDRTSLNMYPHYDSPTRQLLEEEVKHLKERIFFYYSSCYYHHNSDRMHKRWQVARGNCSWDIGINELQHVGRIMLDLAVPYSAPEEDAPNEYTHPNDLLEENWRSWYPSLAQFRQYAGLTFRMYDENGIREHERFDSHVREVKEYLQEPVVGPHPCVFFEDHRGQGPPW